MPSRRPLLPAGALDAWNRRQQRARNDYHAQPIVSAAVCELCGKTSKVAVCRRCADTYPSLADTRRALLAEMRKVTT